MAITSWYYDYYEPGTFPNQRELCVAVAWTCNLEGQSVSKTSLSGIPCNPLTIRLLAVKEALQRLEISIEPINKTLEKARERFHKEKVVHTFRSLETHSNPSLITGGAPVDIIEVSGENKPMELYYNLVHLALYEFFSNFVSVLDRLAYEINLLYALKINKVDWTKLVDTRKGFDKYLKTLSIKDAKLCEFIINIGPNFIKPLSYRNRLIHDGMIRFQTSDHIVIQGLNILLADNPNDDNSPMNTNAVNFCKESKLMLLKLLDGAYELMVK